MLDLRPESKTHRLFVGLGLTLMWCLVPLYAFIAYPDPTLWWKVFGLAGLAVTIPINYIATIGGGYRFVVHGKH